MKSIEIDRTKLLKDQPGTGHNRWHPDVEPLIDIAPGEELVLEMRDGFGGYVEPGMTSEELMAHADFNSVHAMTGPVWVQGAEPGDLLEVEYLDITTETIGFTAIATGMGFLRDLFTEPYLVHWNIDEGWATSPQIPGVRVPGAPFTGLAGVAPSHAQVLAWTARERDAVARGFSARLPSAAGAVPFKGPAAEEGLRTMPPRENGGNMDMKQMTKGNRLLLPVFVDGALFSAGDGHFAQGDGEVCVSAVETGSTAVVRFRLHKGEATRRNIRVPQVQHDTYGVGTPHAGPERFTATMGLPIRDDGTNDAENLNLAARNALIAMIDVLQERGFTRNQAYVISSVAVDLRVSAVVDLPNVLVSAVLNEAIFG